MNKAQLIAKVADLTGNSKKETGRLIESVLDVITDTLVDGEEIAILGFGTFGVKTRAARVGRNPQTGEEIEIKESIVPFFKPGKALKTAVSDKEIA